MPTAAIYCRVSTEDQVLHGMSLETQAAACIEKAASIGSTKTLEYRDEGISGMSWERPGLQALLRDLPNIDIVIVWTKDRLARNLQHLLQIITAFSEHGVRLIALYEHVATDTADGMFALQVSGAAGEYHARRTAENVKAAMNRLAKSGRKPSGNNLGYDWQDKQLIINPQEAETVRLIYNLRERGMSTRKITTELIAMQAPTKRGGRWNESFIRKILCNPTYTGRFIHGGEVWQGNHEPIITQEQFDRVQALSQIRRKATGPQQKTAMPIFRCGYCGSCVGRSQVKRAGSYVASMFCHAHYNTPHELRHEVCSVLTDKAFAMVWRHTELMLTEGVLTQAIEDLQRKAKAYKPEAKSIEKKLIQVAQERARLQLMVQRGMMFIDEAERPLSELQVTQEELQKHLEAIILPADIELLREFARSGNTLIQQVQTEPGILQLQFLKMIYDRIELTRGKLTFISRGDIIPPVIRDIPPMTMYCPLRGKFDLGF